MTLGNLLYPETVVADLKATDRWEAIAELVDTLLAAGQINSAERDGLLGEVRKREEKMSTGIGSGIAIPHASCDQVNKVVAAFGRSQAGIEFDALDDAPVHFVVLFAVPKDEYQTHLRTLAGIAKFLNDRKVRDALAAAPDSPSLLAIFQA